MTKEVRIGVGGMICASCSMRVERAIGRKSDVESAAPNLITESVTVEYLPATVSRERIAVAIRAAGYEPAAAEQAPDAERDRHGRELRALRRGTRSSWRRSRCPFCSFRPAPASSWGWLQLALATPVLLWSRRRAHLGGRHADRGREPGG